MTRMPVTPFATKSGRYALRPRSSSGTCVCMSHKPGMTNFPVPSRTRDTLLAMRSVASRFKRPLARSIHVTWVRTMAASSTPPIVERPNRTATIVSVAKKAATIYACVECGNQATKWLGRCPECNAWNSYAVEEAATRSSTPGSVPIGIADIDAESAPRLSTRIPALDRVLGGGLVFGSVTLVGGEPGIGKSTLLLQAAEHLSQRG